MEIKELEPKLVWKYFSKISEIPRCSGDEKEISDYLVEFAKENNFEVCQDEALNVIIKKEATKGYEDHPTIALQAHMDMVCVKEDDSDHDFSKDPIKLLIDDGWVKASGTTLGADDGMGVAYILAYLTDESAVHGPIEAVITTGEETSMVGANALDTSKLRAKYLINIDSEEEGVLTIGCAGGLDLEIEFDKMMEDPIGDFIEVNISGLEGGHSGMEIDKFRLNAIKALSRLLVDIDGIQIAKIEGGVKRNAIPTTAKAIISTTNKIDVMDEINKRSLDIINESKDTDPNAKIDIKETTFDGKVMSIETSKNIIECIYTLPDGLYKKYKDEIITSSNLGTLDETDESVIFHSMIRSQIDSAKFNRAKIEEIIVEKFGGVARVENSYTGWQREDTKLTTIANDVWSNLYDSDMEISTTHGGLECGLFKGSMPDVEMISFGPEITGAHSPAERVNIKSVENNYKFLKEFIKRI